MARRRVKLTFPKQLVTQPIIYYLGKEYDVITNIRRADVTEEEGWVVLELEGVSDNIDRALKAAMAQGVRIDPVEGDVIAG